MGPLPIIHEDDALIAVAKPAGLATANVPAGEASLFTVVRRMLADRTRRPEGALPFLGVVSRLDRHVSGVVVLAKTSAAAAKLAAQFRDRSVAKTYVALVEGRFPAPLGTWTTWHDALERPDRGPTRQATGNETGQTATLRARVTRRLGEVSLVELEPATGRRHQLRAQLAARGCPIVGDRRYGARLPFPEGIALHARLLAFDHPLTGARLLLGAEFPDCWRQRFSQALAAAPPLPE
jgi:23S rRNA pseudouridine1911/1915/1917 synthase